MAIRVQEAASVRLDEIYRYTRDMWGEAQAETYITGLFAAFEQIETRMCIRGPCPSNSGWKGTSSGTSGISRIGGTFRMAISVLSRSSTSGCTRLIVSRKISSDKVRCEDHSPRP